MNYSSRLIDFVTGIVITSIVTVTYPPMTRAAAKKDRGQLQKVTGESLSLMSLMVIPATIGLMIFSPQIVRLLFFGGAFGEEDVVMTSSILFFYALGVPGIGFREIQIRVYYALGDMKTPVINSVIMVLCNVTLSIILGKILGLQGLSLATSISLLLGAFLLYLGLKIKRLSPMTGRTKNLGKILFASLCMGLVGKIIFQILSQNLSGNVALLGTILLAATTYGILLLLLKVEELYEGMALLKNRNKKRNGT